MVLEVSKAGRFGRVTAVALLMSWMREPAFESSSAIGRGTKWSVAPEAVWQRGGRGALAGPRTGDLRLPAADKDHRQKGWADGLRGLGRDGPPCERGTDVGAGDDGLRSLALAYE